MGLIVDLKVERERRWLAEVQRLCAAKKRAKKATGHAAAAGKRAQFEAGAK